MYGGVFLLQGGEFQRPWKRCSMVANAPLEVETAMGHCPVPIYVSRGAFALRYEVPKFLARGDHLCMATCMLTIKTRGLRCTGWLAGRGKPGSNGLERCVTLARLVSRTVAHPLLQHQSPPKPS